MRRSSSHLAVLVLLVLAGVGAPAAAAAAKQQLQVQIISATNGPEPSDPKLEKLAKQLAALKFKSYQLKDQAKFELELGSSGRMQLPGGEWMDLRAMEIVAPSMLRTELEVKKLEFKATVSIAEGATVVLPGPPFGGGTLILAVTRAKH